MVQQTEFTFDRSRGIVWVCDLENSSKYLNDNASAAHLELFLPRLHWTSRVVVSAAGGRFVKSTGDGFLAWFETALHRQLGEKARACLEALWHLTFLVNTTQLGVEAARKFRLRHGAAYEHDALLTRIVGDHGSEAFDLTGRAVVLAFRLSSIPAAFPGVATQSELAKASAEAGFGHVRFRSWKPTPEERLRYFKGERWGTNNLVLSTDKRSRKLSLRSTLRRTNKVLAAIDSIDPHDPVPDVFAKRFVEGMLHGPTWAKDLVATYRKFVEEDVLATLRVVAKVLGAVESKSSKLPAS